MILRLLYVGFAVESVDCTRRTFRRLFGLPGEPMAADPFFETDKGARIAFPNDCWLYLMESRQPDSSIYQFLEKRGPGLERVAFLTDEIEGDLDRVRKGGVMLSNDAVADTPSGRRFVVAPEYVGGITVELVQPNAGYWEHCAPSNISGVLGLQHIGVAARDLEATCDSFARMFDLHPHNLRTDQHDGDQKDMMIEPGNDRLWLHVTESWGENARVRQFLDEKGEGLEHLCIEVDDIREAVKRVTDAGTPVFDNKIFTNRPDGFEAFVYPEHTDGVTVELIEPYPTSRGYRPRRGLLQAS
jgi:catechol 2,3-dioxygenase-like lactoylglutathione lyase family enzyme